MKLTIIGHWGGFPKVGEASSSYLLEYEGYKLLLECGSGCVSSIQKIIHIKDSNCVLLSHYHYDHFCDIGALQYGVLVNMQLGILKRKLPIYAPIDNMYLPLMTMEGYTEGHGFNEESILNLGPFTISFSKNTHPVESFSMKIKCDNKILGYTSDTSYYEKLPEFLNECDILLSECSFYENMDGTAAGHLNSIQAGKMAEEAKAGKLILTHLPHFGNLEDLVIQAKKHYSGEIIVASYMKEINI